MKKLFLLIMVFLTNLSFSASIQERKIDPNALSELAYVLAIPKDTDLVAETQKRWLRRAGQERWEMNELSSEQKQFVLDWAEKQGFFSSWEPALSHYDKALILGATTQLMQKRLDYLKGLWVQGIRFQEVVWLTGDRPLVKHVDDLTDRCQNESEAARILWDETDLPEAMKTLPAVFVAVPMKREGTSLKRPNTEDTIFAWLETTPPCKALFVSDQPFCGYQFAVIKSCLPEPFQFDLVGPGANPASHPAAAAITLDSIARWIYQENSHSHRQLSR